MKPEDPRLAPTPVAPTPSPRPVQDNPSPAALLWRHIPPATITGSSVPLGVHHNTIFFNRSSNNSTAARAGIGILLRRHVRSHTVMLSSTILLLINGHP